MRRRNRKELNIPIVDLFAGPGGLGEGFSSFRNRQGYHPFQISLSVEKDPAAHRTLELRSFFRQFPRGDVPDSFYRILSVAKTNGAIEQLFAQYPTEARRAKEEAWLAELGGRSAPEKELDSRIRRATQGAPNWVLIGGPPCQAYSVVGRARNNGVKGYRPESDKRHFLYREYLKVIARHWPAVFVMENVKGILSSKVENRSVFHQILDDLSNPAFASGVNGRFSYRIFSLVKNPSPNQDLRSSVDYEPEDYVVPCEEYGVPQSRHRVILLGIREDLVCGNLSILKTRKPVATGHVLDDLPRLRSGLSEGSDSAGAWKAMVVGARDESWLQEVKKKVGRDVHDEVMCTIEGLTNFRADRGSEFVPYLGLSNEQGDWYSDSRIGGVWNHSSRQHMSSDLHRYLFASCYAKARRQSPKLIHFPRALLPKHKSVRTALATGYGFFSDRFRVQLKNQPATTITSHIAKDGHYYIHYDPRQCRALTVREAARLQTFPDNYIFLGNRTEQYVQVGNAVPPLLAKQIAKIIYEILDKAKHVK